MSIDTRQPPVGARTPNDLATPQARAEAAHAQTRAFVKDIKAALGRGSLSPQQASQFVDSFKHLFDQAASLSSRKDAMQILLALQSATTSLPPLHKLSVLADHARDDLKANKPMVPLRPDVLASIKQQAASLPLPEAMAPDEQRAMRPHRAPRSPSDTSREHALQRKAVRKGARSPRLAPAANASANKEAQTRFPNPYERRTPGSPDEGRGPQAPAATIPAQPPPYLPQARPAGGNQSPEFGRIEPFPLPKAQSPYLQVPQAGGVEGLGLRGFDPASRPPSPRLSPELDRPLTASDRLVTTADVLKAGEGNIFALDEVGHRFRVPEAYFLAVKDRLRGDVAMVESKRLGGGTFGDFSVGLMAQPSGAPVLTAVKKIRSDKNFSQPAVIEAEATRHKETWSAFQTHLEARERLLAEQGVNPLAAVRAQTEPARVYRAVYDPVRERGLMVTSVFDGDVQPVGARLRSRFGTSSAVRNAVTRSFLAQAGTQLGIMHDVRGEMHLDFKPANVLFNGTGQMTVADFGLSMSKAEAATTRAGVRGSMPAPEMYDVFAPPNIDARLFQRFTPKTDSFCLSLSALDMLACDSGVRLARWQGTSASDRNAQVLFLQKVQDYLAQLEGPPGRRTFRPGTLPSLGGDPVERALNQAAISDPQLTQVLLAGLEANPADRPLVQDIAREAAAGLPPADSRAAKQTLAFLSSRGDEMRQAQPRSQLQRLAPALPNTSRGPLPTPPRAAPGTPF